MPNVSHPRQGQERDNSMEKTFIESACPPKITVESQKAKLAKGGCKRNLLKAITFEHNWL